VGAVDDHLRRRRVDQKVLTALFLRVEIVDLQKKLRRPHRMPRRSALKVGKKSPLYAKISG
jgi:hypothetical protein